jgi:hypothetical protein
VQRYEIKSVVRWQEKGGGGFDAQRGTAPAAWATPEGRSKKNMLLAIPELILRCFSVHLEIIPDKIIFQLFEVVREHRFFNDV